MVRLDIATPNLLNELNATVDLLSKLEWERVKRPELGQESLSEELKSDEDEINRLVGLATEHAEHVHDNTIRVIVNNIQSIRDTLQGQAQRDNATYLQQKQSFIQSLRQQIEQATEWKPIVAGASMVDRGLLDIEDFKAEIERIQADYKREAQVHLENIRTESTSMLDDARTKANEVIGKARQTAEGISVDEAQKQFRAAAARNAKQAEKWTVLAAVSVLLVIGGAVALYLVPGSGSDQWLVILPGALLKIFILSVLAGVATFAFRMLRAHLHLAEKNRHREHVANCVGSFIQAAADQSQRDLILAKLTDSIVSYGDSGLVQHEREDHSSTMSGELIGRIVAAISGKGSS